MRCLFGLRIQRVKCWPTQFLWIIDPRRPLEIKGCIFPAVTDCCPNLIPTVLPHDLDHYPAAVTFFICAVIFYKPIFICGHWIPGRNRDRPCFSERQITKSRIKCLHYHEFISYEYNSSQRAYRGDNWDEKIKQLLIHDNYLQPYVTFIQSQVKSQSMV